MKLTERPILKTKRGKKVVKVKGLDMVEQKKKMNAK